MALILVYFALFLLISFASKVIINPGSRKLFQMLSCFILLFLFFGFRDITVLNDTPHYYGSYYTLSRYNGYVDSSIFTYRIELKFEWGYQVLVHFLMKYVSKSPYTIILFSSFVFSLGNVLFFAKYTKDIALSTFLFLVTGVLFDQFCLIRQTFALMLFYIAYGYLQKDKNTKYCLIILCAALFHTSALILLVLPLLKKLDIRIRNVIFLLIVALVVAILIMQIFSMLGMLGNFYLKTALKRSSPPIAAILDGSLMFLLIGTCIFLHKKMGLKNTNATNFWCCILGVAICVMTPFFLQFFRFNIYIWPIIYTVFMKYANSDFVFEEEGDYHPNRPLRRIIMMSTFFLLIVRIVIVLAFKNEWYHVIPYSFYDFSDRFHYYNMYYDQ